MILGEKDGAANQQLCAAAKRCITGNRGCIQGTLLGSKTCTITHSRYLQTYSVGLRCICAGTAQYLFNTLLPSLFVRTPEAHMFFNAAFDHSSQPERGNVLERRNTRKPQAVTTKLRRKYNIKESNKTQVRVMTRT